MIIYHVYTKGDCRFCEAAKKVLTIENKTYNEIPVDESNRDEVLKMFPSMNSVPIITFNGELIGGYNDLLLHLSKEY